MDQAEIKIKIVLADDHELIRRGFRESFKRYSQINLVAEAANGEELWKAVNLHIPDIVITDIRMPVLDGVEVTRMIKDRFPKMRVIALSNYNETSLVSEMMCVGADGYLLKNASKEEIFEAIKSVKTGKTFYCSETSTKILTQLQEVPPRPVKTLVFTAREIQIMQLIGRGKSSRQIAEELSISTRTVESHRQNLFGKIGVRSAVGIALYATRHGYI